MGRRFDSRSGLKINFDALIVGAIEGGDSGLKKVNDSIEYFRYNFERINATAVSDDNSCWTYLTKKGSYDKAIYGKGPTALIHSASRGHISIVKALLNVPGINVTAATEKGDTALIWASHNGYTEIVKLLLSRITKTSDINHKNAGKQTARAEALRRGYTEIVDLIDSRLQELNSDCCIKLR